MLVLQAVKLPWYVTVLLWQLYNHCKARRVTVRWSSKITEVAEQTIRHYILHPAQLAILSDQSPDSHLINVDFRQSQKQKLSTLSFQNKAFDWRKIYLMAAFIWSLRPWNGMEVWQKYCTDRVNIMNSSFFGKSILLIFSGSIWGIDKSGTS